MNDSYINLVFTLEEISNSDFIVDLAYYDLEEDKITEETYKFDANSAQFVLKIPKIKNKTLFEVQVYKSLYPDYSRLYNFILYGESDFSNELVSLNPYKINFDNNEMFYENFVVYNAEVTREFSLKDRIEMPYINTNNIFKVEIMVDIACDECSKIDGFSLIESRYENGKIILNQNLYYNFLTNQIVFDEQHFKVDGINFPVEKFKMIINFYGVGNTFSNIKIEQEYHNLKKLLGNCEESIFCFH